MPIVAGIPVILVGWQAVPLYQQVSNALAALDDGAAFIMDDGAMRPFLAGMRATVGRWSQSVAAVVVVAMLGINAALILLNPSDGADFGFDMLRTVVMAGVGYPVGLLLGRFAGFAQLFPVMEKNGIKLAGLSTPAAQKAMRSLEGVFRFAVLSTAVLCHWFLAWLLMWSLGCDPRDYRSQWLVPFMLLWGISFALYVGAAWLPTLAFQRRLDALYGSSEERRALDVSLEEAEAELKLLNGSPDALNRRRRIELSELERYIADLNGRRFRSQLLDPRILTGIVASNIVLLVISTAFWFGGVRACFASP